MSIKKILIANRGEIALRIMRTAKSMGINTVAVFSEIDRKALHTIRADEAICIGPAPSRQSYLHIEKIIAAAKATRADAIHPGYGFLSENPLFAKAVAEAGLLFIGPPAAAMEKMGSKITAKQTAAQLNIPLVPGTDKAIATLDEAYDIAHSTGYPLLIKAAAGGGGKGMRVVESDAELEEKLRLASSEALAAFGDGSVFLEKMINRPRHIEIQVMCDKLGHGIYLFERECSIQRRHQKIIEEAPSTCLSPQLRKKMGEDAVKLALSCGYEGAGTVEFLVDADLNYYFLEMNTRLQVEHPVTELITGLDLVRMQIEVAEGRPLPINQDQLRIHGHSIELRICTEDPFNDFLPSIGTLTKYNPPSGHFIRVDDGYTAGMEIPLEYDPMIGKLIVHGNNRLDAIAKLKQAILDFEISGVDTTLPFGLFVLNHPDFIHGNFDTHFISSHYQEFLSTHLLDHDIMNAAALVALKAYQDHCRITRLPILHHSNWQNARK